MFWIRKLVRTQMGVARDGAVLTERYTVSERNRSLWNRSLCDRDTVCHRGDLLSRTDTLG